EPLYVTGIKKSQRVPPGLWIALYRTPGLHKERVFGDALLVIYLIILGHPNSRTNRIQQGSTQLLKLGPRDSVRCVHALRETQHERKTPSIEVLGQVSEEPECYIVQSVKRFSHG